MKAITIAALIICSLSMTGLAMPLRGSDGIMAARSLEGVNPRVVNEQNYVYHALESREQLDVGSATSDAPITPFLAHLVAKAQLVVPSAPAATVESLIPSQMETLETEPSEVVYNMTSTEDEPSQTNSTSTATSILSDSATSLDGSIQTESLLDLVLSLPIIGPLLGSIIGIDVSSITSAVDMESITPEQSAALAELLLRLFEEFEGLNSTQSAQNNIVDIVPSA